MFKNRNGFTIVELLIVIVVIAILAAISIVAYNGIQNRAKSSSMASAGAAYIKAYALYRVDNSTFPGETCLGSPEDYPADPPFLQGECYIETDANNNRLVTHEALNNSAMSQLEPYIKGIKLPKLEKVNEYYGGNERYHIRGFWLVQNGLGKDLIGYALPGDRQCAENGGWSGAASKNYNEYSDVTYCYFRIKTT